MMVAKLEGKVALVTGSARGIGAGIAERLASEGAAVAINYSRSADEAEAVAGRIRVAGGKATILKGDMGDAAQVKSLVTSAHRELGGFDILVNNAAAIGFQPVEQIDDVELRRHLAVNIEGPIAAMRAAAPLFPKEGGRVVNISSLVSFYPIPGNTVYAATKGALDAMTRVWAAEFGARQICVNAVSPGLTDTDAMRANVSDDIKQALIARTPLGRVGMPADIASAVAFLASADAQWITGQVIIVSGGFTP
jgi:3-oxoacyl-[acyl-carrier protein] reductase